MSGGFRALVLGKTLNKDLGLVGTLVALICLRRLWNLNAVPKYVRGNCVRREYNKRDEFGQSIGVL